MRTQLHSHVNQNKFTPFVPDVCPKCGERSVYLEATDNSVRCKNMMCGYRGAGAGRSAGRTRRYGSR